MRESPDGVPVREAVARVRPAAEIVPWRGLAGPNFRRAFRYLRPDRRLVLLTVGSALLFLPFALAEPLFLRYLIDTIFQLHSVPLVLRISAIGFAFFAVYGLIEFLSAYWVLRLGQRLHARIKADQLRNLLGKSLNFYKATPTGRLIFCFFNDSNQIGSLLSMGIANTVLGIVLIVLRAGILLWLTPTLLLIFAAVVPLQGFVMYRVLKRVMRFQIDIKMRDEELTARIESLLGAAVSVKGFGFGAPLSTIWDRLFWNRLGVDFRSVIWQRAGGLVVGYLQMIGNFSCLIAGTYLLAQGRLTQGDLLAFMSVSGRLAPGVIAVITFFVGVQEALVGLERYYKLYDLPGEEIEFGNGRAAAGAAAPRDLGPADIARIRVQNVDIHYATKLVQVPCDFRLEEGRRYLWHGPNGAGKTSVGLALAGLVPHGRGTILCGDTPLCDFALASVRRQVLYVSGEPFWPERTLAENFTNSEGNGRLDRTLLADALRVSEAQAILDSLPLGMQSILDAKGHTLSRGECQRLFLAMALYRRPRVLILDEALSSVASGLVRRIIEHLVDFADGTTLVYISHTPDHLDRFTDEVRFRGRV